MFLYTGGVVGSIVQYFKLTVRFVAIAGVTRSTTGWGSSDALTVTARASASLKLGLRRVHAPILSVFHGLVPWPHCASRPNVFPA